MEIIAYVPAGTSVETRVGPPPKDQSAEVEQLLATVALLNAAVEGLERAIAEEETKNASLEAERDSLLAEVARLQRELDLIAHPAPRWVGPDITIPQGIAGQPLAAFSIADRFVGTAMVFFDSNGSDTLILSSDGVLSGTYAEGTMMLTPSVQDGWGRQAVGPTVQAHGAKPADPPPPPPPPPPPDGTIKQYLTWDAGDGPSMSHWSRHLLIEWKNPGGDWIDADGAKQGDKPLHSVTVPGVGWVEFDVTAAIKRQAAKNTGLFLRTQRSDGPRFAGRLSANPPELIVDGKKIACHAFASFSSSGTGGIDSRQTLVVQKASPAILQFADMPSGTAKLRLYCERVWSSPPVVEVYECDAPTIQVGGGGQAPILGLAAAAGSEVALKTHPDVLRAGDFSDILTRHRGGTVFDGVSIADDQFGNLLVEQLPDPDYPGSTMLRGMFEAGGAVDGDRRGSSSFKTEHMRANVAADPMGVPEAVEDEMFCRLYFFLEDDWNSTRDGNKMAIGWDLRLGWWNRASGGYWQSITGNGGAKGDGSKRIVTKKSSAMPGPTQAEYWGHAIRMEAGKGSALGNPYGAYRPVQSYAYNLDQPTAYGDMLRLGNAVIVKGRWFCIEQQIRMNSLTGPEDWLGNREAVADGVLRTWLDGVVINERTNLRWRRHPEMGIQGPWVNWYYGGKAPSEMNMHYRMNHLVVARKYIGPRV
jgi:hypothetical protein